MTGDTRADSRGTTARPRDFKSRSRAAFDRQARTYDSAGYGRHALRLQPAVLAALEPLPFSVLLDVGCGTGRLLEAVAAARPGLRLLGIDLSPEMLAVARERLGGATRAAGVAVDLHVADAEHLPFADGTAEVVTCVDSFHHYPDPAAALAEMHRVTRSGGALVIGEWHVGRFWRGLMNRLLPHTPSGDVRIYTPEEMATLAASAGYAVERSEPAGVRGQLLVALRP